MWRGDQAGEASRRRSKSAEQRATKVTPPQRRMSGGGPRRPGSGAYHPGAWRDLHGVARQILAAAPEQEVVRINLQHPTSLFSPSQSSAEVSSRLSPASEHQEAAVPSQQAEALRELAELKSSFKAREAELLARLHELGQELQVTRAAQVQAEAEAQRLRGELERREPSRILEAQQSQAFEVRALRDAVVALEQELQGKASRQRLEHFEQMVTGQQAELQQEIQRLWGMGMGSGGVVLGPLIPVPMYASPGTSPPRLVRRAPSPTLLAPRASPVPQARAVAWPVALVPHQDRRSPSPTTRYQVSGLASPVLRVAVPAASPRPDSPPSGCVPLSTPGHERVRPKTDQLAQAARASLGARREDPLPDPLLQAQGSPALLARTPEPPEAPRRLSSLLESQPSLASSFLERDNQYTSAKLLRTSSSKRSRGMSPGPVVRPPSPREAMREADLPSLPANMANVVLALFELFCSALEATVMDQLVEQMDHSWEELVKLRPLRTLAQSIASLLSGSAQLKEEGFWEVLGDEEEYQVWWKALLARHGLYGSSDSLCAVGLASLLTSACRLLRDSFAPSSYLRNLRTVRFGAHRLGDRYEDFRLVSSTRLGRSYRCRGRLSYEDRHCSQIRKDRIACPSDQLRAEAELVRAMQHPNLHRVVESFEDFNSIYIISELVDSVRLLAFLGRASSITEGWLSEVMGQLLGALSACHARGAVHGALGPDSVGLQAISDPATNPKVIVSDMALASFLQPPGNNLVPAPAQADASIGPCLQPMVSLWQPPYYAEDLECCSPKQDVWACGCLLYILLSGCMPLRTNDICFGGPYHPPPVPYEICFADLRCASPQAEALCSQMLETEPKQRPTAQECLCYPWLQPESPFLSTPVSLLVLERLAQYDARIHGSQKVVTQVIRELSQGPVSCESSVFAKATLPQHFDGSLRSLDAVRLTPLGGVAPLLQMGLSVASISLVMESFDLDGTSVAQGFFVRRCLEMAEDQLDDRLWRLFVEAREDHRGLMAAARLEQLLETTAEPCEVSAQEVRQLAAGQEVSFEALKDFVMQRREAACLARAQELGLV